MAKKRKTRNQKILADKRHILYHLESPITSGVKKENKEKQITTSAYITKAKTSAVSLDYVRGDVKKILLLTSIIIVLQITLFFILTRV